MKKKYLVCGFLFNMCLGLNAQVSISKDNSPVDASAGLDVNFNNKGFLAPRMTCAQRDAVANPAEGLIIFCTNCVPNNRGAFSVFSHGKWTLLSSCLNPSPIAVSPTVTPNQITWRWTYNAYPSGYKWNTANDYDNSIDLGQNTFKTETGISCDSTYIRYVWAYYNCGVSSVTSLSYTTPVGSPSSPTAGTHNNTSSMIVWNWNNVAGASGYKWNTINNYNTAIDIGGSTNKTEYLDCDSLYTRYIWAYNFCGASEVTTLSQSTSPCPSCLPFTDNRDGKTYSVKLIGGQCWMAQNLDIGSWVISFEEQMDNGIIEKYCYDDYPGNCEVYGGLYQFNEAIMYQSGLQGICPDGWHLPSDDEWCALTSYLDTSIDCLNTGWSGTNAGGKLKDTIAWASNNGSTNSSGFTALPAGLLLKEYPYYNTFSELGLSTLFWTSTLFYRGLNAYLSTVERNYSNQNNGLSVRCIKDY